MKGGETNAVGAISKLLTKFGPETVISSLQCITQTGSGNPRCISDPLGESHDGAQRLRACLCE